MRRAAPLPGLLFLALALLAAASLSMSLGALDLPLSDVLGALGELLGLSPAGATDPNHFAVIVEIRAPRAACAAAIGAVLGVSGAVMQGLFRNPLADPALLGVSLGAALGGACVLVLVDRAGSPWLAPLGSFVGGVGATLATMLAARRGGGLDPASVVLGGIAVQAFCGASIGLLTYVASDAKQRDLTFWLLGSLGGATWDRLVVAILPIGAALLGLSLLSRALDALTLGEAEAHDLGIHVPRVRVTAIVLTSLGVGASVAVAGPIGFVGLVVPHLIRLVLGPQHRVLVPGAALGGAVLMLVADTLSRTLAPPAELPIGVVTAFLGAPFFYFLLSRRRAHASP